MMTLNTTVPVHTEHSTNGRGSLWRSTTARPAVITQVHKLDLGLHVSIAADRPAGKNDDKSEPEGRSQD